MGSGLLGGVNLRDYSEGLYAGGGVKFRGLKEGRES